MEYNKRRRVTAMSMIADIEIKHLNDGTFIGKLRCKFFEEPFLFTDFVDLIEMMEIIFDTKGFPERQLLPRTFGKNKKRIKKNELDLSEVARECSASNIITITADITNTCNYELSVKFRHKAEWQGSLLWREKGVTSSFASIVELSRLLNEAFINNL
jgi:hypothetical protein